ncbi:MAG: alpha-L-rhamnosidase, partial [Bacteroidota bacterium]|nr:alpha-L-rhamnosidase [Bacteroidota bacterium]
MKQIKLVLLLLFLSYSFLGAEIQIKNLKVEYDTTPLGIDVIKPRFSWQMQQDNFQRGARQKAFQLVVTDEAGRVVWNSGKLKNDQSLNMEYAGVALTPSTRYIWKVNVWDQDKKKHTASSWFETGLMNPGMSGWSGAKWIGGGDDDLVLFAQYLPVFKIDCSVQLD